MEDVPARGRRSARPIVTEISDCHHVYLLLSQVLHLILPNSIYIHIIVQDIFFFQE
jgi:hypothetical protein